MQRLTCLTLFSLFAFASVATAANPVLSVASGTGGTPAADSAHGWEFTANAPIIVTHLGLYDHLLDGMDIDHPIGIFRLSDAALLTSGAISAGVGDTLIDNFRYVDTPDITLQTGTAYVIAYYSAISSDDNVLAFNLVGLSVDPVINYGPARRWEESTGGLVLPMNTTSDHRFGPNFLFIIPEPSTILLAFVGLAGILGRRRR